MRIHWRRKPAHTPTDQAAERFWKEWGSPSEPDHPGSGDASDSWLAYLQRMGEARTRGDRSEVRRLVTEGARQFPKEPALRLTAAAHLQFSGDNVEAMAQLAVVIASAPELYTAYVRLAQILCERGEREATLDVLKVGWSYRQREVPRRQRAAEKARFFALLDTPSTVTRSEELTS